MVTRGLPRLQGPLLVLLAVLALSGCAEDGPRGCTIDERALGQWEELPLPPVDIDNLALSVCRDISNVVWTGKDLLVWGGCGRAYILGGRYEPELRTWTIFEPPPGYEDDVWHGTPTPTDSSAVWTGEAMLIWGGHEQFVTEATPTSLPPEEQTVDDGLLYYPGEDRWERLDATDRPLGRHGHAAVWTGEGMYIYGGVTGPMGNPVHGGAYLDFATRSWRALPTEGMPEGSQWPPSLVWTSTKLIAWGGGIYDREAGAEQLFGTGAIYDPTEDRWAPIRLEGAPSPRYRHLAVWTGREMIVWGRWSGESWSSTGAAYDPATDTWRALSLDGAPVTGKLGFWLGTELLVPSAGSPCSGGALYTEATDTWTPLAPFPDSAEYSFSRSLWTGDALLRYGGVGHYGEPGGFWMWTR